MRAATATGAGCGRSGRGAGACSPTAGCGCGTGLGSGGEAPRGEGRTPRNPPSLDAPILLGANLLWAGGDAAVRQHQPSVRRRTHRAADPI